MNTSPSKIIFGSFFVLIGIGFLTEIFLPAFSFGRLLSALWPIVFVFIGVASILNNPRNPFFGIAFVTFGLLLIVANIFDVNIWRFWPIILIGLGLSIIFDSGVKNQGGSKLVEDDDLNVSVLFWGAEKRVESESFKGGKVSALFGGVDIDLRSAKVAKDGAELDLSAVFGGISVVVPENTKVVVKGSGFFGAFEDKTYAGKGSKGPTLTITGSAIFGGVEIK